MGCVSYSLKFFTGGKIGKSDMKHAETAARIELETIKKQFSRKHWQQAVGSSGTARAMADIIEANGWSTSGITREGMERLRQALLKAGDAGKLDMPGLKEDRIAVLPGGFAIMSAIFAELDVEHMEIATGAMRQGILWDMIGRGHRREMRELTVRQFMKRYHVDAGQAHRIERLAVKLYEQLGEGGKEKNVYPMQMLSWAARLQEIGLTVAHSAYHKHSSYIVANADMPGFSKMEQAQLSMLVLAHRGSLGKLHGLVRADYDWSLLVALRLAALMHRSRSEVRLPAIRASRKKSTFTIDLDAKWLVANPLTAAELREEIKAWKGLGVEMSVPQLAEVEAAAETATTD
jgi:exopolyphosphatase/guanosine-5'-triphosphate,3'-diphosphate pyrophosphatase